MTDTLYIRVDDVELTEPESGHKLPWKRAVVFLEGVPVVTGYAPNFGQTRLEGIAESSAISQAQDEFCRNFLTDIRGRDDSRPPWISTITNTVTERHLRSAGVRSGSEGAAGSASSVRGAEQ